MKKLLMFLAVLLLGASGAMAAVQPSLRGIGGNWDSGQAFTDQGNGTWLLGPVDITNTEVKCYDTNWVSLSAVTNGSTYLEASGSNYKAKSGYTALYFKYTESTKQFEVSDKAFTSGGEPTKKTVKLLGYITSTEDWSNGQSFTYLNDGYTHIIGPVTLYGNCKIYDENQGAGNQWKGYDSCTDGKDLLNKDSNGDFALKDNTKKVKITYWDNTGTFKIEQVSGSDPGSSSLFPLPTDATITVKGSNSWTTNIQGNYNAATGCFEFNVDYPTNTEFAFTYNEKDYTNREDLSEDIWSTNAVGRGTIGQNFKTTSAANKIIIDNTTGKVKYVNSTESKPTPENFGILVGSDPNFENSLKFIKATDGSNVWTLTAENVQITNGSSIYVLDNNSNRWWIHGEENFRIYGDIENQTLTNAGTTPAPARFHMASATYTINAQITKAEDGTYTLDYVKFTRKKGNVTTPEGWQWGLAFQDLNVSGEWSWGQIEANKDKVPLFELSTAAGDGAKAYIFKKTLTLKQGKYFSLYYKDAKDNVKQMNFGPNSTTYDILNNRNLLRLHESNKANKFGLGTYDYEVTMEVWQEDGETWYCRFDFGGEAEPNTIYMAIKAEANRTEAEKEFVKNPHIYAYTNGSDANNAIVNGAWPGLKEWTKDPTISALVGVDVYKAQVKPRFLRFIANDDNGNQTRNLKIVNNGVYFWDDELLPFGIILKDEDGHTAYRRYANTQTEETTKYVYLLASEFGITDPTKTVYVNIYDKTTGQQVSGLRGTSTAIPEYYHGELYYKVPTASLAEGSEIEIEFSITGGYSDNNKNQNQWDGKCPHCGKDYRTVKDHSACYVECKDETNHNANDIIITYPETVTVTFEEGKVFHRYPKPLTNILTDTKPTKLELMYNGATEGVEATREENGIYYFDGEYVKSTNYYFKATFGTGDDATTSYYQASKANFQMLKSIPYSINETATATNNWILPTDNYTYNIVLSWNDQNTWARANATKAFNSVTPKVEEIEAVPYASEERILVATCTTHKDFFDETTHFGATKVEMIHSNKSEYVRPAHIEGFSNITTGTDFNTAELKLAAHTAGTYTLRITNQASAVYDYQVMNANVTVRPTIESVGLQINGWEVEKNGDSYTIYLEKDGQDEFEMNGYTHSNKRAHVACSPEVVAHKDLSEADDAAIGTETWNAMKANGFKVYFRYNDAAAANDATYRPAAREAAASTVPEGYTEYGAPGVELDMTKARDNNGISFIVEENGVQSDPVTISSFDVQTGIDEIGEEEAAEPVYFDLQGFPVKNPEKGIYIRVINGKADKVLF